MAVCHTQLWVGTALLAALLCGRLEATQASTPADPLVRACQTLYNSDWSTDISPQACWAKAMREQAAGRVLNRMPQAALCRRLVSLLTRLKPGSDAYVSVAYVLAYDGVEVVSNLRRMALAATQAGADEESAWVNLPDKLAKVYWAHPSEAALRVVLRVQGDGELSEDLASVRGGLFLAHPCAALHVAAQDKVALSRLAGDLAYETVGEDGGTRARSLRRVLRRLARAAALSNAARVCLSRIRSAEREERQFPR